jgi:hypothetical protein
LALWLGYSPIYLLGVDASHHSKINIDKNGVITGAGVIDSSLTVSELMATDGSKRIVSLPVASNPSIAELTKMYNSMQPILDNNFNVFMSMTDKSWNIFND